MFLWLIRILVYINVYYYIQPNDIPLNEYAASYVALLLLKENSFIWFGFHSIQCIQCVASMQFTNELACCTLQCVLLEWQACVTFLSGYYSTFIIPCPCLSVCLCFIPLCVCVCAYFIRRVTSEQQKQWSFYLSVQKVCFNTAQAPSLNKDVFLLFCCFLSFYFLLFLSLSLALYFSTLPCLSPLLCGTGDWT